MNDRLVFHAHQFEAESCEIHHADCPWRTYSTPVARRPAKRIRQVSAPVITMRFGRGSAGRRNALAVLQRSPSFWVTW